MPIGPQLIEFLKGIAPFECDEKTAGKLMQLLDIRNLTLELETPDGIRLTVYDPTLAEQMEVAEQVMRRRRTLLNKLAQ